MGGVQVPAMETRTQTVQRPKTVMEEREITVQEPRTVMETKQVQVRRAGTHHARTHALTRNSRDFPRNQYASIEYNYHVQMPFALE